MELKNSFKYTTSKTTGNKVFYIALILGTIVGLLSVYTGFWSIIVAGGIFLLLISFLNPKFGVFILVFLLLGLTKSTAGLTESEIAFMILFSCLVVGWFVKMLIKKTYIPTSSINLPLFLFLFVSILSIVKAYCNNVSINDWFAQWKVFLVFILFFVIISEFETREELKKLISCFVLVAILIGAKDVFFYFQQGVFALAGEFAGIDYASFLFIMATPFLFIVFIFNKNFLIRLLSVTSFLLIVLRISISLMRSYILAFLIILCIFFILSLNIKNKKISLRLLTLIVQLSILISVPFLFFPQIAQLWQKVEYRFRILSTFYSSQNLSVHSRLVEIESAWNCALQQPLLGRGFGFKYQYYRPNQTLYEVPYVHFTPLFFVLDIGFIGLSLVTWLIVRVLRLTWQAFKKENDLFWKLLIAALFSNFIGYIVISFFDTSALRIDSLFYFTLAMGIVTKIKIIQDIEIQNRARLT